MNVTVHVPDRYLIDSDPAEFGRRMKLYAALLMFQSGELSGGAAAELAEVDRITFMLECGKHGIPTVDYPPEELEDEVRRFLETRRG